MLRPLSAPLDRRPPSDIRSPILPAFPLLPPEPAMRAQRRFLPMLILAPLLFAGKGKCGPCGGPEDPDEDTDIKDDGLTRPEIELQVISIDPSQVQPESLFDAVLFGAGFETGARVWLGEKELQRVVVSDENTMEISGPALVPGRYDVRVKNPNGDQATLRAGLLVEATTTGVASDCRMIRVQFGLDSASLDTNAQRTLSSKLSCFQNITGVVKVDGHCDERGTTEYNLALGSRRASAVERWLVSQGVPPSRVRATSYGEERPLVQGHDESAWGQNRRAEIQVVE